MHYSTCEDLDDKKNLYHCEACTKDKYGSKTKKAFKSEAITRTLIYDPPRNLIINLKRFTFAYRGMSKNNVKITYPINLILDEYMIHKVEKEDLYTR